MVERYIKAELFQPEPALELDTRNGRNIGSYIGIGGRKRLASLDSFSIVRNGN